MNGIDDDAEIYLGLDEGELKMLTKHYTVK
jgi:hypothetical protein